MTRCPSSLLPRVLPDPWTGLQEQHRLLVVHRCMMHPDDSVTFWSGQASLCALRYFLPQLWPIATHKERLQPHEQRGSCKCLYNAVHQCRLPLLKDGMAWMDLHVPREGIGGNCVSPCVLYLQHTARIPVWKKPACMHAHVGGLAWVFVRVCCWMHGCLDSPRCLCTAIA